MKHATCFLFLLFLLGVEACQKEEEGYSPRDGNGLVNTPQTRAYVKTKVINSATGLPVSNAVFKVNWYGHSDTMVVNNWYTGYVSWGGDPRMPWGHRPDDSTTIYFDATLDTLNGRVSIKAWQLRENDTLRLSDIYIAP